MRRNPLQHRAGTLLRSQVVGDDAEAMQAFIWETPGERWFRPGDPIWTVHADASMFAGGIAALLLQTLHPLALAGVIEHSDYRADPWGRLQRTSHYVTLTTFGTIRDAERLIARVRGMHRRVAGHDRRGRAYAASDPELLRWVHVAEVGAFLHAFRLYGATTLTPAEEDTYVAQAAGSAQRLGATDVPQSVEALHACLEDYRPDLEWSPGVADTVGFLRRPTGLAGPAAWGYQALLQGSFGILPTWARTMLRVPDSAAALHAQRLAGRTATATARWAIAGLEQPRLPDPA